MSLSSDSFPLQVFLDPTPIPPPKSKTFEDYYEEVKAIHEYYEFCSADGIDRESSQMAALAAQMRTATQRAYKVMAPHHKELYDELVNLCMKTTFG